MHLYTCSFRKTMYRQQSYKETRRKDNGIQKKNQHCNIFIILYEIIYVIVNFITLLTIRLYELMISLNWKLEIHSDFRKPHMIRKNIKTCFVICRALHVFVFPYFHVKLFLKYFCTSQEELCLFLVTKFIKNFGLPGLPWRMGWNED